MAEAPIEAVLIPPQLRRFRAVAGVEADEPLRVEVRGWHKLVVLAGGRAFLFPRHSADVEGLQRELVAYRVLERHGVPLVPRVVGEWDDPEVYPHPFAAVTRVEGTPPRDATSLFDQLGAAVARWHAVDPTPEELRDAPVPPDHLVLDHQRWIRRALDPSTVADAVTEAVERLDAPEHRAEWTEHLGAAADLGRVLVHGDVHEDQLLAVGDELTGVLDWETARIDHPFFDFDFGEWGTALWREHRHEFPDLWRRQWEPYARARGLDLPVEALVSAFEARQRLFEASSS